MKKTQPSIVLPFSAPFSTSFISCSIALITKQELEYVILDIILTAFCIYVWVKMLRVLRPNGQPYEKLG